MLTDMRSEHVKARVLEQICNSQMSTMAAGIDTSNTVRYARTELEEEQHLQEKEALDENSDDEDLDIDESKKEYIFLIDRSGSMYHTIKLARQALILFLHSLPAGSKFNICSYGSRHEFMFDGRSVDYND